jgi:hypothetical protein
LWMSSWPPIAGGPGLHPASPGRFCEDLLSFGLVCPHPSEGDFSGVAISAWNPGEYRLMPRACSCGASPRLEAGRLPGDSE